MVIPNATIYTQKITVFNAYDARRTTSDFVISNDADPELARELMIEAMSNIEGVLKDPPPSVTVTEAADSGVCMTARWWTDSNRTNYLAVRDKVIPAIMRKLSEHNVELPYPTRQIFLRDQTAEADGERTASQVRFLEKDRLGMRVAAHRTDNR